MTYKLTIEQKPTYLHAVVTGQNSRESVAGYMQEIHRECETRKCFRVLIEERLEGPRLGTMDVFQLVSDGSQKAKGIFKSIAFVDVNAANRLMQFAETVAVNRAIPMAVFSTVAEAQMWLLKQTREAPVARAAANGDASRSSNGT